jgi:hypothetical protein
MRRRLRRKLHREYLTTVCGWVVTFDDELRQRLLQSEPGTPFRIEDSCNLWVQKLVRGRQLRYLITVARKLARATAVVVYWAEEFSTIRDEAVIFSADDLGQTELLAQKRQEQRPAGRIAADVTINVKPRLPGDARFFGS